MAGFKTLSQTFPMRQIFVLVWSSSSFEALALESKLLVSICCVVAGDTLSPEEVQQIINAADKDGDGSLSYEEFVKIMLG